MAWWYLRVTVLCRQRPRHKPPTSPNSPTPSPTCSHSTSVTTSPVRRPTVPRKLLRSNHSRKRSGSLSSVVANGMDLHRGVDTHWATGPRQRTGEVLAALQLEQQPGGTRPTH